jgi:hypothetical protein
MAYTTGGTIQALDYNLLTWGGNTSGVYTSTPSNFAYVWGVGNGQFGYGQDADAISTVSAGGTVTATQWSTFVQRLNLALAHQSGAGARLASGSNIGIVAGATIQAFANVATAVTTINTNKLDFNSTRGSTTASANFDATFATTTFTRTITVTFASADQARYFFNAGGRLSLVFSPSGLTDNNKETSYNDLMNAIGTLHLDQLTSTRTGTGETLTTNGLAIGYWDLTTSNQTILKLTSDNANYTANTLEVFMRVAGAAGSNGGLGTQVIYDITYTDGADEAFNDAVSGTFRHRIDVVKPEVTYLADVWGTITVS